MSKMDVYGFAKKLMADEEFNIGGIPHNERKYLDAVGFEYTVEGGCIACVGEDAAALYDAMRVIRGLQAKYSR